MSPPARVRPPGSGSLDLATTMIGVVLVGSAAGVAALLVGSPAGPLWVLLLFPGTGLIYAGAGLVAWRRRPSNRLGPIMIVGALSWLTASLINTQVPLLVAVGTITATLPIAVAVHLMHAFPSGRLTSRASRAAVALGYLSCTVLQVPRYVFAAPPPPGHLLTVADRPDLQVLGTDVRTATVAMMVLLTAVVLVRRIRHATPGQRHQLVPLLGYGLFAAAFVSFAGRLLEPVFGVDPLTRAVLQIVTLAAVPVAFVGGVLRGGFRRTGRIDELAAWLGTVRESRAVLLQETLADTLGDPSVTLVFAGPQAGRYLDADGHEVATPGSGRSRAMVEVELAGRAVGAVCYDATVIEDPELVRQAGQVVAFAVDHERLTAEVYATSEELRRSRERIVVAADTERRRIAHDLHDGLQMRLVLLALQAHAVGDEPTASARVRQQAEALRRELDAAAAELRGLVHGLVPAALIERGLYAATEDLVDRVPIPTRLDLTGDDRTLSEPVRTAAYFAIAEGLTNAVKHSAASRVRVRVRQDGDQLRVEIIDDGVGGASASLGSGLRGLVDRLDVIQGSLRIESPPHQGTRLEVRLPCGS